MINKFNTSPIMIAGMHRSGTSMTTKLLKKCGLQIGNKLDSNSESIFFQRINIWMMSLLSSSWDSPRDFSNLNSEIKEDILIQLKDLLDSRSNSIYFGWGSLISKGSFENIKSPWGWKDPRNTFTSSIWREIFPDIKTLYIVRHPVDTVESLMKRQKNQVADDIKKPKKYSNIIKAILSISHTNYNSSMLLNSYDDAFKLTETYYKHIIEDINSNSRVVRYEDILLSPENKIREMLDFCGIDCSSKEVDDCAVDIDSSRAYAYRDNSKLIKLEKNYRALVDMMGYNN